MTIACDSNSTSNPAEPEPEPEAPIIVESFDGQLGQAETSCNDFTLTVDGNVTMEITALAPLTSLTLGLALGQQDSSQPTGCAVFVQDDSVRINEPISSSGLLAGLYCSCVFDVGNIFPGETVDYTLEVSHP